MQATNRLHYTVHCFQIEIGRRIYILLMVRVRLIGTGKREMRFKRGKRCLFPARARLVSS